MSKETLEKYEGEILKLVEEEGVVRDEYDLSR